MQSAEIRKRFLEFFKKRGHTILPSASLVAADDSKTDKTLFTTAGMQPLIPYLLGQAHPEGERLASIQKCVRTGDIDDVGDNRHLTFFEMMGNWSLGDYFKEDAIKWSYEFLTSKEEGLGLDPKRLYVTIFEGDEHAPLDEESRKIWLSLGIPEHRIYPLGKEDNWWSPGENGPSGPDTEMFYDLTENRLGDLGKEEFVEAVQREDAVEIWNDVFMEHESKNGKIVGKLARRNVDTGAGLERMAAVMQGVKTAYETDIFRPLLNRIAQADPWNSNPMNLPNIERFGYARHLRALRIIADHTRTAFFMIADSVFPSSNDRGYVLRRLIRRAIFHITKEKLQLMPHNLVRTLSEQYSSIYQNLNSDTESIEKIMCDEELKFLKTINNVNNKFTEVKKLKETIDYVSKNPGNESLLDVHKLGIEYYFRDNYTLSGKFAFLIYQSDGAPVDLIKDFANENQMKVDWDDFNSRLKEHQNLSRAGAEAKFKGGLAGHSDMEVRYHTATHLLHQALRDILGNEVAQKGSNITPERLRFDFSFPRKVTDEEKKKVEDIINDKIKESLPVNKVVLAKDEAEKTGALHFFGEKYPDEVSVYYIGDSLENAYSKEFCGGPHVANTVELGKFKIVKEEAVSTGVRRIKAVLE